MKIRSAIVLLSICLAGLCLAAQGGAPSAREEGGLWVAANEGLEIAVDKNTGAIRRLLDRTSNEDYCNQKVSGAVPAREFEVGERVAGITLYDELANREFSDLAENATVTAARSGNAGGSVSLSVDKTFPGADFTVTETFTLSADHLRWDVRLKKTQGKDRTVRVIQFAPLPLGRYRGWAPISDSIPMKPYTPWAIEYGQSVSGAVGEARWRTNIPMVVFYSRENKRAISFASAFEVPAVRVRFLNNTGATADFHWNSRHYPMRERPYLQVSNEYLGLRDNRNIETSLLISVHPSDWRPALGWVYERYRKYFDADPKFDKWDGVYASQGELLKDALTENDRRKIVEGRRDRGVKWEEQHGHFPWYGLMIPKPDVETWVCDSHLPREQTTLSRDKIRRHHRRNLEFGIGTFIYYNITEAEYWYAEKEFPESIARDESDRPVGAFRAAEYPDKRACYLMNADPVSPFGQHMIRQAKELVEAYPDLAGFFWDVYGRSYMFDFAHDDGITMVNNKPAYYPLFMYERMMRDHVGPLLRSKGMTFTANKPTTITACEGLDGIMVIENTPEEETPHWIAAQSFLGLNRHMMMLDGASGTHAELFFQDCLRYGLFYSDLGATDEKRRPLPPEQVARNKEIEKIYAPFIQRLKGKKWIFHPEALELPENTDGNIFRLPDGSVMVTVTSPWRILRKSTEADNDLEVICRLPDAASMTNVYVSAVDLRETAKVTAEHSGDMVKIVVPRHGRSTVILLSAKPDKTLEATAVRRDPGAAQKKKKRDASTSDDY
ncbi:MAG TPA: hypothetical protein VLE22_17910 [Bryobacteraceae bacterium]|nr:hypothetical protein [Bryobacteraceae bacterium]